MSDGIAQTKVQIALDSTFRFGEPVDSDIGIKVNDYTDLIVDKLLAFFGRVRMSTFGIYKLDWLIVRTSGDRGM